VSKRIETIDVLRGLTVALMILVTISVDQGESYRGLLHTAWNGLTLADVVFPTFMFVVGMALGVTLDRYERLGNAALKRKIATRTAVLFACGFVIYWFPFVEVDAAGHTVLTPLSHARILGVLQRIALGYCIAALIVHEGRRAGAIAYAVVALLGYWWVMHTFGDYSLEGSAEIKLDKLVLGEAHMYHGEGVAFDPEGILSTVPAVVNVLAGYLAWEFVRARGVNLATVAKLLMGAATAVATALAWNTVFPINKKLWTSSFVLCTVGIDLAVLAALLYLVELAPQRSWTRFFSVFGRNALILYLLSGAGEVLLNAFRVKGQNLLQWCSQAFGSWAGAKPGSLAFALVYLLGWWVVARAMDRRGIYVRL